MALLEEIEHTSPDAHAGIKKKIWDKVSAKLTAEQNTIGVDRLGLMEGAPQGIPFDNLVVDDNNNNNEESDKEVDELEGSEQDAISEDPATRSRQSTKGSESTTTGRPVAASSQVVPDGPRTGPSAVTSGGGTSDRDAAGAAAGMLNPADQADQAVGEAASVEEPSARGEKQSAGASESDGATAARTDSLRAPEAGVSKPAPRNPPRFHRNESTVSTHILEVWGLSDLRPSQRWRMRRTSYARLGLLCCLVQGLTPFLKESEDYKGLNRLNGLIDLSKTTDALPKATYVTWATPKPPVPPGSTRANTGATVKGPVLPPSSKAQPANSTGKISEDYPEIVYETYGDYVYHPDFPFFKDISEFVVTGYEKEDYTLFYTTAKEYKEFRRLKLYYDSESQTLTMTQPHVDHEAIIGNWRDAMKSILEQFAPPKQLQEALDMAQFTAPQITRMIVNDSDNQKWPDSLFGTMIGKNHTVELGLLEVGGSQYLHGRQGVLAVLEGMAHHHQVEVRAGKTRQWAQMTVFKLYEHGANVTLKHVIKKKGKESGDEEPVMSEEQADVDLNEGGNISLEAQFSTDHQGLSMSGTSPSEDTSRLLLATAVYESLAKFPSLKISGWYPRLGVEESSPDDTTVLLPGTGPWKQGASELIVGALRVLWFHVPFNRIDEFYRVLQEAKGAASKGCHALAEEMWIIEGFALPILPINVYHGQLCPILDKFLESLQESLNVVLDMFQEMWTMPEVSAKLRQLDDPEIDKMYGTYLDHLIARPKMDFKCIIKDLVLRMPRTMCLKAENKARVKDEEVTKANKPLTEQTEEIYKELMARKLKRKHNVMEVDGTGEREPKVASSSTSGLAQGSDCSSMLTRSDPSVCTYPSLPS
ncbi:hypothetical protein C8Q72DRAFT_799158 [Fomitopsis betulina]|nr:hypothetical protein C8Q72DRAFT_799158 [Fomitopsis betulina]